MGEEGPKQPGALAVASFGPAGETQSRELLRGRRQGDLETLADEAAGREERHGLVLDASGQRGIREQHQEAQSGPAHVGPSIGECLGEEGFVRRFDSHFDRLERASPLVRRDRCPPTRQGFSGARHIQLTNAANHRGLGRPGLCCRPGFVPVLRPSPTTRPRRAPEMSEQATPRGSLPARRRRWRLSARLASAMRSGSHSSGRRRPVARTSSRTSGASDGRSSRASPTYRAAGPVSWGRGSGSDAGAMGA